VPDDVPEQVSIDAVARGVQAFAEIAPVPLVLQDRFEDRRAR